MYECVCETFKAKPYMPYFRDHILFKQKFLYNSSDFNHFLNKYAKWYENDIFS